MRVRGTDEDQRAERAGRAGAMRHASVVVALLLGALGIGGLAACNLDGANVSVAGGGSPTATTRTAPQPTLPPSGPPAVLGAPGQKFIAKYGQPTAQSNPNQGELHFYQYSGSGANFLVVQEGKYLSLTPGETDAATILVTAPPGGPWTASEAKQVCAGFGPADAQFVQHVETTSQGAVVGWDDIYHSDSLASVFPSSAFEDVSQNPVPAGSFDIAYIFASSGDTGHVTSCTLAIGERQTVG